MTASEPIQNQLRAQQQQQQQKQFPPALSPPPPAPSGTRTGKIARLPREIREELNRRLDDGETAVTLLPWLNAHPAVRDTLAAQFHARPLTAQNLSQWRLGGYQDWLQHQDDLAFAETLLDESAALSATTLVEDEMSPNDHENSPAGLPLSDRLSSVAALALAKIIRTLTRGDLESPKTQKSLLHAIRTLNSLRSTDHRAVRLKMDLLRWEEEKAALQREASYRASQAAACRYPSPLIESRIATPPPPHPAPRHTPPPAASVPPPSTASTASTPSIPSIHAPILNDNSSPKNDLLPVSIKPDQTKSNLPIAAAPLKPPPSSPSTPFHPGPSMLNPNSSILNRK